VSVAAIERQISVRSTREDLIRRGILKDVPDTEERNPSSAVTGKTHHFVFELLAFFAKIYD